MQLVFITSPLVHWCIITFWLHPNLSMTSAVLSDTLAAPQACSFVRTQTHTYARRNAWLPPHMPAWDIAHAHFACMHAHVHKNADTQTTKCNNNNKKSHLQIDRHRHLSSAWAEIILDQYNSVSEPKHKLGSCWKTLLHAKPCLCVYGVWEMNPTNPVPPSLWFSFPLLF